jgi:hypothetical protein
MKLITSALLLTLLFLLGCDQVNEINAPSDQIINKQLISLPLPTGLGVEDLHTEYKDINGYYGGWFSEAFSYQGGINGTVNINSTLHFFANSFTGTKTITQTFNTETAAITFGPSMQFNLPVDYTLTITGVDLTNVNPNSLDFVYIDSNGNMYAVNKDYVIMDLSTGMLKVKNAKLNHFSRYGFVN